MPGREYGDVGRYGFNGKENDNEVKGEGNHVDYGWRVYDPRLGRFLSFDPLHKEYNDLSPYHFAGLNPIRNLDRDGGEPLDYTYNWQYKQFTKGGKTSFSHWSNDPSLGYIDVEVVYDNWTKQNWFIHQGNDGKYYYWKHNPGADQAVRIVSNKPGNSNGQWVEFETQDAIQARFGAELADAMGIGMFGAFAAITGGIAIEGAICTYGASTVGTTILKEATEEAFQQATGIPIPGIYDLVKAGFKSTTKAVIGTFRKEASINGKDYVEYADEIGASSFSLGKKWDDLTPDQRWAANQFYLDEMAKNKATFFTNVAKDKIDPKSALRQEVDHLINKKGYVWKDDTTLIPGGN